MIKLNTPFYVGIQSFVQIGNKIVWTTASKTPLQRVKDWFAKRDSNYFKTSEGWEAPGHGQYVYHHNYLIHHFHQGKFFSYTPEGAHVGTRSSKFQNEVNSYQALIPDVPLQGIYRGCAVFGALGREDISITKSDKLDKVYRYEDFKKWWWRDWEAEGINPIDGRIHIGICVRSWFGYKVNYLKDLSE